MKKGIYILAALLLISGCAVSKRAAFECPSSLPRFRMLRVPSFLQTAYQCGPAALAMVLNFYGADVIPDDITASVYSTALKGTLITDLKNYARKFFPRTKIAKLDMCELLAYISKGVPPILFVDLGGSIVKRPHYLVATGYDLDKGIVYVHTGYEANAPSDMGSLEEAWKKTGHLAIIVEK